MIGYLRGKLIDKSDGKWIVGVGSGIGSGAASNSVCGTGEGVGYLVTVPQKEVYEKISPQAGVELFIYSHIREDAFDLYGFFSKAEKELFLTLLSVNGIGPKGALNVLSRTDPASLVQIILEGDKESLYEIPGIGKKTAERIVLELRDPLKKKTDNAKAGSPWVFAQPQLSFAKTEEKADRALMRDAKEALLGLGYREPEVVGTLNRLFGDGITPPQNVEDLIRSALKHL